MPTPMAAGRRALGLYLLCVAAAPMLTAHMGLVPVGFGLTAPAGTAVSALTLWARGTVLDAYGRSALFLMWLPGSALAALFAPAPLVVATVLAFLATEAVTAVAWTALRPYGKWAAAGAVFVAGIVIDVMTYVWIADMPLTAATAGKLLAKAWLSVGIAAVGGAIRYRKQLLRDQAAMPAAATSSRTPVTRGCRERRSPTI